MDLQASHSSKTNNENINPVPNRKVVGSALCQTGNQMFCAVAAMTYAKITGRRFCGLVKVMNKCYYPEYHTNTILRNVQYIDNIGLQGYTKFGGNGEYLCNYFPVTDVENVWLNDFFQDVRCVDRNIAYSLFKPYPDILKVIYEMYPDINDMVCIQVRRGDYVNLSDFNCYSKEELLAIIDEFFQKDKIIFVSDDIKWCKDNFHGERYYFADKEYKCSVELDLYLQTQSKANVISNSTFGWWGAFLNEHTEKVVCHWPWFKPGKINNMKYILPEEWIKFNY